MRPSRNATLLVLLVIAILVSPRGLCQSRLEIVFTNRTVTFTNLQGQVTADANLIRAAADEVVFKTNDIYGTVKFTNLAPSVLEYLGVPPSYLKLLHDQQEQLAAQAARELETFEEEQAKLLDPANLIKVKIESVVWADYDALYGSVKRCNLSLTNGEARLVYVARLPAAIPDFLNKQQPLTQTIVQLTGQIEIARVQVTNDTALVNQAKHEAGVKGVVRANIRVAEGNLLAAKKQLDAWASQLKEAQVEMDAMNKKDPSITSVLVLPSQYQHNGGEMMICSSNQMQDTIKKKKPK